MDVELNLIDKKLHFAAAKIEEAIDNELPPPNNMLDEAMRYAALETGGSRIRPFLFLEVSHILIKNYNEKDTDKHLYDDMLKIAVAIELIHSYSLVHDDLPALDNDNYRRGKPALHKKYGSAIAVLAGDALLGHALGILSRSKFHHITTPQKLLITSILAQANADMIQGQSVDIILHHRLSKNNEIGRSSVSNLHKKTSALFDSTLQCAFVLSKNVPKFTQQQLRRYMTDFGIFYQLADDLCDCSKWRYSKKRKLLQSLRGIVNIMGQNISQDNLQDYYGLLFHLPYYIMHRNNINI